MHDFDRVTAQETPQRPVRTTQSVPAVQAVAARRPDVLGAAGLLDLQRLAGNEATTELVEEAGRSPVLDVLSSGGGQPLAPEVRQDMEGRLGHDFGDVRVRTDTAASDSARAVGAHAYTVGSTIVFQRDRYDPSSTDGRTMLAHELTHVVQQRQGPVEGTDTGTGIKVSDPQDRFEREAVATAEAAISAPAPLSTAVGSGPAAQRGHTAQRHEAEEEELQGAFVQREEAEEEELQGAFVQREEAEEEELVAGGE